MTAIACLLVTVGWSALAGVTWALLSVKQRCGYNSGGWAVVCMIWPVSLPWIAAANLVERRRAVLVERRAREAAIEKEIWN